VVTIYGSPSDSQDGGGAVWSRAPDLRREPELVAKPSEDSCCRAARATERGHLLPREDHDPNAAVTPRRPSAWLRADGSHRGNPPAQVMAPEVRHASIQGDAAAAEVRFFAQLPYSLSNGHALRAPIKSGKIRYRPLVIHRITPIVGLVVENHVPIAL
jgi:hypothetical protein